MSVSPQVEATDPAASVFVSANAGAGKTWTLVKRVTRLLLAGARPETILCVTYTKAGAAEMQRRLFQDLGDWAVMADEKLGVELAKIDEAGRELSQARALFARALETPGGLKIQTIHGFCERLLRRFPLEAGVSPGFTVLEDAAAAEISRKARDAVADLALAHPDSPVARAYAHFSVQLDWNGFNAMFAAFEARRAAIHAYVAACEAGVETEVWRALGFAEPGRREDMAREAMARIDWARWKGVAAALRRSDKITDQKRGAEMLAVTPNSSFDAVWPIFLTQKHEPRKSLATNSIDTPVLNWLIEEQGRHLRTFERLTAAAVAEDTVQALYLASAYETAYRIEKDSRSGLDFSDLVDHAIRLLTVKADAAWVLFKLDGGIEHVLLDEAQDTAPEQWDILRELTAEFFTGAGAVEAARTMFAVGDEKQSIFSFQGARPERLALETAHFAAKAAGAEARFHPVKLLESWRSAPEILAFVDKVYEAPDALAGLRPAEAPDIPAYPVTHYALRDPGGCVELWPIEQTDPWEEPDPWLPVDAEPAESANKKLARRIAREIKAMAARGDGVLDRASRRMRPCGYGDVLILVRRRNALFHEIIRALKREGVAVGGADRLKLSEHAVFEDLIALARFARFPSDDLTLACLLRGPFCDVNEESLFDLAYGREEALWGVLTARADERAEWLTAHAFLAWTRDEAAGRSPFDFYHRVLGRLDAAGRSMRQRILTRLGAEAEDALEAFLAQALAAEERGTHDLETFIARMAATELEVKREQDEVEAGGGGQVRVMTAHGAKGLEAPIVILPDTTSKAKAQGGPLLETAVGGFLWAPRKDEDCPASAAAREAREGATAHESARLLYVALTRARDRLIIAGVESQKSRFEGSWREYIERAFGELPQRPFALEDGAEGWRFGPDPVSPPPSLLTGEGDHEVMEGALGAERNATTAYDLPAWTQNPPPAEPAPPHYAAPSQFGETGSGAAPSPLMAVGGLGRYRRGDLIHRLLQILPDIPPAEREVAARALLARERDLRPDQRAEMAGAALGVLNDPRFAAVFGPGSKAEVALAGAATSGRVDRLVVENDRVLVIDFKTNRPAPERIEDADPAYVRQMAIYAALLKEIFPGRAVEAALVWTDGPRLMAVPEAVMAGVLAGPAL